MTYDDVATAMVEWATDATGIPSGVGHEPETVETFPDVWATIKQIVHTDQPQGDGQQLQQVEQSRLALYETDLMFLVDGADDAEDAAGQLASFSDDLRTALEDDPRIGGLALDREFTFDFHPSSPFVELDGGERARRMTLSLVAVEHI